MEIKEQVSFSEFETEEIKEIKNNKTIFLENGKFNFRKFIANIIFVLLKNFGTKIKWQFGLVIYLIIVVPVGTYIVIKNLINFIF